MAYSRVLHVVMLVSLSAVAVVSAGVPPPPRIGGAGSVTAFVGCGADGKSMECRLQSGIVAGGYAHGTFNDTIALNGWSNLEIWTREAPTLGAADPATPPCASDFTTSTAFAVGCVEGHLTQARIFQMLENAKANMFPGGALPFVAQVYLEVQQAAVRLGVDTHYKPATSLARTPRDAPARFWTGMAVTLAHFDGLASAYNMTAPAGQNISKLDLYAVSSADDLTTLSNLASVDAGHLAKLTGVPVADINPDDFAGFRSRQPSVDFSDCSVFIRLLPEDDTLVSHTTWSTMWEMLRVYKMFHLSYAPAGVVSFSSYPGFLSSGDDFYVARDTQLAVVETTNNIYNNSLYWHLDPLAAFSWQRAITATWFATGPSDWAALFSYQNSGTYNCNWFAVKLNGTRPTADSTDFLVEVEQIPGLMQSADLTSELVDAGYIASYNIPRFKTIYDLSGYNVMYEKHGNAYSFTECPRAQIFKRNISDVVDVATGCNLIRYNNYQHDPLSLGDPMNAVASRGDLLTPATAFGAYDAKLVSSADVAAGPSATLRVHAVSGPTHAQLPPFSWTERGGAVANVSHIGQPDVFDFEWLDMVPRASP